jgi:integrase
MLFWTKDEYLRFSDAIKDKPMSYYAFQILYWTGIRSGELLALTREDFDLEKRTLRINKTYQVVKGEEMITSPKTEKSNRTVELPQFLCDEMQDYFDSIYKIDPKSRLFPISKHFLHHEMDRGSQAAGVKRIRIHDLRHSSCALLIELGYSPIQIVDRLGHETSTVTERYSHLYPSVQRNMADKLNETFITSQED